MSLRVKPITVTAKGCPCRVVLVAQHSPRRAEDVRQRRVTWILCRSPKRRLACAASSSPPRKRRRASGAESWQTHRSQLAITVRGIGMASRRSTGALGCVEGKHQAVLYERRQHRYLGMPLEPGECL